MDALSPAFVPTGFSAVAGWTADDMREAYAAFRRSAFHVLQKPYRSGALGVRFEAFAAAYEAARKLENPDIGQARAFFEEHFRPARVVPPGGGAGFVTSFYEPEVAASAVATEKFAVPFLARPHDLVEVDDANRPAGFDPAFAYGRRTPQGIVEYFDREAIDRGALAGRGLEIAFVADKVDAFFVHVQGAGRLTMRDGSVKRITFAAKTGHPFTGIGRRLAEWGEIALAEVTMQSIRAWLKAHPGRVDELLWQNRSYIFFREAEVTDPKLGQVAAAKVPLTPGRSLAVDRFLHTFGTPFFIQAPQLTVFDGKPFRRLMIAQDTGTAIVGEARGDLFAGCGDAAGEIAGVVRATADFVALLPRPLLEPGG